MDFIEKFVNDSCPKLSLCQISSKSLSQSYFYVEKSKNVSKKPKTKNLANVFWAKREKKRKSCHGLN